MSFQHAALRLSAGKQPFRCGFQRRSGNVVIGTASALHYTGENYKCIAEKQSACLCFIYCFKSFFLYFGWNPDGVGTNFRYGCEEIPVYIYFNRYYFNTTDYRLPLHHRKSENNTSLRLGLKGHFKSLSFFGKLSWDSERRMIDAVPLIITNIQQ